jgi:hypothetical protein
MCAQPTGSWPGWLDATSPSPERAPTLSRQGGPVQADLVLRRSLRDRPSPRAPDRADCWVALCHCWQIISLNSHRPAVSAAGRRGSIGSTQCDHRAPAIRRRPRPPPTTARRACADLSAGSRPLRRPEKGCQPVDQEAKPPAGCRDCVQLNDGRAIRVITARNTVTLPAGRMQRFSRSHSASAVSGTASPTGRFHSVS